MNPRTILLLSVLLGAALHAGEVPVGHAGRKPSPTDPVGFAGQGRNWYPGATPPTGWWDGTPTIKKVKGVFGNPPSRRCSTWRGRRGSSQAHPEAVPPQACRRGTSTATALHTATLTGGT